MQIQKRNELFCSFFFALANISSLCHLIYGTPCSLAFFKPPIYFKKTLLLVLILLAIVLHYSFMCFKYLRYIP